MCVILTCLLLVTVVVICDLKSCFWEVLEAVPCQKNFERRIGRSHGFGHALRSEQSFSLSFKFRSLFTCSFLLQSFNSRNTRGAQSNTFLHILQAATPIPVEDHRFAPSSFPASSFFYLILCLPLIWCFSWISFLSFPSFAIHWVCCVMPVVASFLWRMSHNPPHHHHYRALFFQVLGTPTLEEIYAMNPYYSEFNKVGALLFPVVIVLVLPAYGWWCRREEWRGCLQVHNQRENLSWCFLLFVLLTCFGFHAFLASVLTFVLLLCIFPLFSLVCARLCSVSKY